MAEQTLPHTVRMSAPVRRARWPLLVLAGVGLLLGLGLAFGAYALGRALRPTPTLNGAALNPPAPAVGFVLTDETGRTVVLRDFAGQAVLLTFGTVADGQTSPLRRLVAAANEVGSGVQVVFVPLNPHETDPAAMAEFLAGFDGDVTVLQGSPETVAQLARAYDVHFGALVDGGWVHSHTAVLIDPNGMWRAVYVERVLAVDIAADLRLVLAGR